MYMSLEEFTEYKSYFNDKIKNILLEYVDSEKLMEMVLYSLKDGKRLRPIIALDICNSLSGNRENGLKFAIAIELIHSASLIIDDLPCMDDDDYRRGDLSFHKRYSENLAQLVSSDLYRLSMKLLIDNFVDNNNLHIIMELISKNLGLFGAALGQLIDVTPLHLYNKKDILSSSEKKTEIIELINKKTTSFFEIAFVGGYVLGNGNLEDLENIKRLSKNFGLAFQIYDDFDDIEQDNKRNKIDLINPNFISNFGKEYGLKEFMTSLEEFKLGIKKYNIDSKIMNELCDFLESKVKNKYNYI